MQVASCEAVALRQLLFSCIRRRLIVAQGLSSPPGKAAKERPAKRKSMSEKTPQKVCPVLEPIEALMTTSDVFAAFEALHMPPTYALAMPCQSFSFSVQYLRKFGCCCRVHGRKASLHLIRWSLLVQKKQRLVKGGCTGSAEKEGKKRLSVKKESSQLEDVEEEALPQSQPSARKPQPPPRQKLEAQAADSDEDDLTPVITGYSPLTQLCSASCTQSLSGHDTYTRGILMGHALCGLLPSARHSV